MYTFFLFLHFVALALGVGTGFALLRMGIATKDLPPAEKGPLFQKLSVLRFNGLLGLIFLILSGLGMLWQRPGLFASAGGLFHAKLSIVGLMVIVMTTMFILAGRAKKAGTPPPPVLPKLGNANLFLSLIVILLAVLIFH